MSNILNKVKEAVNHDHQPSHSTNAGPHDSNAANRVDPLVDSDRNAHMAHGNAAGTATGTTAGMNTGMHSGNTGTGNAYSTTGAGTGMNTGMHTGHTGHTGTGNAHAATGAATGMNTGMHTGSTNAGPHNTNIGNKVDPRVDSDLDGRAAHGNSGYASTGTYGTGSANNGPHNSKMMNKLDPRVDSDRDGRDGFGADTTTKSFEQSQLEGTATSGTANTTSARELRSSNNGPHNSKMMNKMDPRVDSDRDHRAAPGGITGHSHSTGAGTTGTAMGAGAGAGALGAAAAGHGHHSHGVGAGSGTTTTAGPHNSNIANEMDPRVDSDRSNYGANSGLAAGTGTGTDQHVRYDSRSTNAGPHDSNMANKMDPRVDSDMDNRGRHQQMGTTPATAAPAGSSYATTGETGQTHGGSTGPHKSSLLNKFDPRVDSHADRGFSTTGNAQR